MASLALARRCPCGICFAGNLKEASAFGEGGRSWGSSAGRTSRMVIWSVIRELWACTEIGDHPPRQTHHQRSKYCWNDEPALGCFAALPIFGGDLSFDQGARLSSRAELGVVLGVDFADRCLVGHWFNYEWRAEVIFYSLRFPIHLKFSGLRVRSAIDSLGTSFP